MRNEEERAASLALRDGGRESARKAVDWYRDHDRLHCGDQIAMATDALDGYRRDVAVGKDALLLCDTVEMADALNRRIHDDTIPADAPTVTAARGQRIAESDLILSRRNDPTVRVWDPADENAVADPVRNGDRWRVAAIDLKTGRLAGIRLTDGAGAVFDADYVREHITHGYATTVHSAQGVTADATHAVLGENTTRSMLYVAMTRARDANTAYLYERITEQENGPASRDGPHVLQRGTSRQAGLLARGIIATREDVPITAHDFAALSPGAALSDRVRRLLDRRAAATTRRRDADQNLQSTSASYVAAADRSRWRAADRPTNIIDHGLEM